MQIKLYFMSGVELNEREIVEWRSFPSFTLYLYMCEHSEPLLYWEPRSWVRSTQSANTFFFSFKIRPLILCKLLTAHIFSFAFSGPSIELGAARLLKVMKKVFYANPCTSRKCCLFNVTHLLVLILPPPPPSLLLLLTGKGYSFWDGVLCRATCIFIHFTYLLHSLAHFEPLKSFLSSLPFHGHKQSVMNWAAEDPDKILYFERWGCIKTANVVAVRTSKGYKA